MKLEKEEELNDQKSFTVMFPTESHLVGTEIRSQTFFYLSA